MFRFKRDKAIETIVYIAKRVNEPTNWRVLKLMYLADRHHLKTYGRFITGDSYVAMRQGPVASATYDLIKSDETPSDVTSYIMDGYYVRVGQEADYNRRKFSGTDMQTLEYTIEEYGNLPHSQLSKIVHDEAWEEIAGYDAINLEKLDGNYTSKPMPLSGIIDTLENGERVKQYLESQHIVCNVS